MKKIIAALAMAGVLYCGSASAEPIADGNDVVIPDQDGLIQTIPEFSLKKQVLSATDKNGWFVRGSKFTSVKTLEATQIKKEGDVWRAIGMRGKRFHPVQLGSDGKPQWALIEEVYPMESDFVDISNKEGPCLLVK